MKKITEINGIPISTYKLEQKCTYSYNDKQREDRYEQIKNETNISPDEMYDLSRQFLCFIYPRLVVFRNNHMGVPCGMTQSEWFRKLDLMLYGVKHTIIEDIPLSDKKHDQKRIHGLNLFSKYMFSLWT